MCVCLPASFSFQDMQQTKKMSLFKNKNLKMLNPLEFVFQGLSVAFKMLNVRIFFLIKYNYL